MMGVRVRRVRVRPKSDSESSESGVCCRRPRHPSYYRFDGDPHSVFMWPQTVTIQQLPCRRERELSKQFGLPDMVTLPRCFVCQSSSRGIPGDSCRFKGWSSFMSQFRLAPFISPSPGCRVIELHLDGVAASVPISLSKISFRYDNPLDPLPHLPKAFHRSLSLNTIFSQMVRLTAEHYVSSLRSQITRPFVATMCRIPSPRPSTGARTCQ
jgi:hypothetical protein